MNAVTSEGLLSRERLQGLLKAARDDTGDGAKRFIERVAERSDMPRASFFGQLATLLKLHLASMADLRDGMPAFDLVPFADAMQRRCVLIRRHDGSLCFVVSDPFDADLQAWAQERIAGSFDRALGDGLEIEALLAAHEQDMRAMDSVVADEPAQSSAREAVEDLSLQGISGDSSTVVKLVNSTLYDALKAGASDIHLETGPTSLFIRYRVDGVLAPIGAVNAADTAEQMISRIKVMSDLDISDRRTPQDGRFKVSMAGRQIDFRVSIMPSIFGEDAVLRVLDKQRLVDQVQGLRLERLGFDADALEQFRRLCREPYGMVLVTGPTGSGKTTSLYAAVSEINHGRDKIITIEDPVEYQLPGVLQIPVNEKKGLTFARGLRSILRHDPDKILVGEIRDTETAQIAVQAALTGHLVFTTVHANSAFDVIGRFTHMGVDPYSLVAALNGVMAQRLVRLNCPHCSERATPDPHLVAVSKLDAADSSSFDFHAGRGCGQCRGSGYQGRSAICEILALDDALREMIVAREPVSALKRAAHQKGTRYLREAALDLVRHGRTTLEEINRVTTVA